MKLTYSDSRAEFKILSAEGDLSQTVKGRRYTLRFRGFSKNTLAKVFVDGKQIRARREYDKNTNTVSYILPRIDTSSEIVVELRAKNLMHDNSDKFDRVFELLLRAHNTYQLKADIWDIINKYSDAKDMIGEIVDYNISKPMLEAIVEQLTL